MAFWIWVSAFTAAALALLIVPLVRRTAGDSAVITSDREQENVSVYQQRLALLEQSHATGKLSDDEYAAAQLEAQRQLLADTDGESSEQRVASSVPLGVIALACAVALPLSALLLYGQFGDSEALSTSLSRSKSVATEQTDNRLSEETVNKLAGLEADVRRTPLQVDAWSALAFNYQQAGRPRAAADAWGQANTLAKGQDADVLLGYAETMALLAGGRLTGQPAALVERAVQLEPDSPRGLWFSGMAAVEMKNFPLAEQRWGKLAAMEGHPEAFQKVLGRGLQMVRSQLGGGAEPNFVEQQAGNRPAAAAPTQPRVAPPGAAGIPGLLVSVKLDETIAADVMNAVGGNATLFIYAKAQSGPPMPLAIKRLTASQLPLTVALTDRDAMMPAMKLSSVKAWTVIARISPTGSAIPQKGDWLAQQNIEGELAEIPPFELVIDSQL